VTFGSVGGHGPTRRADAGTDSCAYRAAHGPTDGSPGHRAARAAHGLRRLVVVASGVFFSRGHRVVAVSRPCVVTVGGAPRRSVLGRVARALAGSRARRASDCRSRSHAYRTARRADGSPAHGARGRAALAAHLVT